MTPGRSLKGAVKRAAPWRFRRFFRRLASDVASIPARVKGGEGPRPWRLSHDSGGGDHYALGEAQFRRITNLIDVAATSAVLDIGCGNGRLAWRFSDHLSLEGDYVGFDVSKSAIEFCEKSVGRKRPDFRFIHADIANGEYNPKGALAARDYVFPCQEASRDVVIATSVFTHLLPEDAKPFLRGIARALKPGGAAYVTAYLVDDDAAERIAQGTSPYPMYRLHDGLWSTDRAAPEAGTGYDRRYFLALVKDAGLRLREDVKRGGWSGGGEAWDHQDVLVLERA